jgi:hypothetical protein
MKLGEKNGGARTVDDKFFLIETETGKIQVHNVRSIVDGKEDISKEIGRNKSVKQVGPKKSSNFREVDSWEDGLGENKSINGGRDLANVIARLFIEDESGT